MRSGYSQNTENYPTAPNDNDNSRHLLEVFPDSIPFMIIATAGHVDHGKTSLVRALTGTNTDRLPEEKKRGLTIDLGFAYLKNDSGQNLAFIDVPGHEKFVRNMIAGVGMVDIALVVVAADDGPMPQTLEHIAILQLMSVRNVVALVSKIDLVEPERVKEVENLVSDLLRQAGFENSQLFALASNDQAAVNLLKERVVELAGAQLPRHKRGSFRMAIDRSFILDGSGTVVTGTVVDGAISKGDTVTLASASADHAKSARVRSIHAQNTEAKHAFVGQRCALNVSGELTRPMLQRGDWLVSNADVQCVNFIDVIITPALFVSENRNASAKPTHNTYKLHHWTPAHLHLGTADIPCRIALLDTTELAHGEHALARLICEKPFFAVHGDRFVLRDQSARKTIAGGRVLDPYPPRRGRSKPARLKELKALNAKTSAQALSELVDLQPAGVNLTAFSRKLNLNSTELESITSELGLVVHRAANELWGMKESQSSALKVDLLEVLRQFHAAHPEVLGVDALRLKKLYPLKVDVALLELHLTLLVQDSTIIRNATVYRLCDHEITLSSEDQLQWQRISDSVSVDSLAPPRVAELAKVLDKTVDETHKFLMHCVSHGKLYKVTENRYFLPQTLRKLAHIAVSLSAGDKLTVAAFRDKSGVGRNLVVEILEYFDRCRFTQRIGDTRRTLVAVEDKF